MRNLGGYIKSLFQGNLTSIVPSSIPLHITRQEPSIEESQITTIYQRNVGPGVHITLTTTLAPGTKLLQDLGLIQPKFTRDTHGFDIPSRAPESSLPRINARRFWLNTLNERTGGYRDYYDDILKEISGYRGQAMPLLPQDIKANLEGIFILAAIVPLSFLQNLKVESRTNPEVIPIFHSKLQESKTRLTEQDCNSLTDLYKNHRDAFNFYNVNRRILSA